MFFSKKLQKFENLKHCFFSKKNGFSKGLYASLNCGLGSNDKKENVLKNLELVSKKIGCKKESLITLNQKHSNQVIYFENKASVKNKLSGDAIISKVKNIAIGILTADCAPILFYDPKKKIIGCAHSGWKGALNGIIKNKKYTFDLRGYINKEISNLNIKNIENIEIDTFSEREFFYSYRRSCINKEKDYGRCISVILMT